jgi:hypothetical protein
MVAVSVVEARDYVLGVKHIRCNQPLRDEVLAFEAGALITLNVDGMLGIRVKMDDNTSGEPTPGLKALENAREHWHRLFREQRGSVVEIRKT